MRVVPRVEWGMPGPLGPTLDMSRVRGMWLHHSVTRPGPSAYEDAKTIARIGVSRFGRASYSYVIHPDGTILEMQAGRVGAHTRGHNSTTEAVCFVGNFENDQPTSDAVGSLVWLLDNHRHRWPEGLIGGHRDASGAATACPGRNLYRVIPDVRAGLSGTVEVDVELPVLRRRFDLGRATDDDRRLQGLLTAAGLLDLGPTNVRSGTFDGKFGPSTEGTVREFQRLRRLPVTGVVDAATWAALLGSR